MRRSTCIALSAATALCLAAAPADSSPSTAASRADAAPAQASKREATELRKLLERAHRLRVVGRYEEASELYRRLYERYPTIEAVIREYGETLVATKKYGEAEKLYLGARRRKGRPQNYAVQLERIHMLQGRYLDAADDCLDVLAEERNRIDWVRGELEKVSGRVEGGADSVLKVVESRIEENPAYGEYRTLVVELLAWASRSGDAAAMIEAMRGVDEIGADDLYRLGGRLAALGEDDLAIASLRLALERKGGTGSISGAAFKLSELLAASGRAEESRTVLQHLASRYPKSAVAFRAELQAATIESDVLGRPDKALALYENLLTRRKLPVNRDDVKEAMGKCLLKLGRLSEAREVYAAIASNPERPNPEAQYMAAEVSFFMGEADSALALYSALAAQHPDWERANDAIGRVFLIQENEVAGGAAGGTGGSRGPAREDPLRLYATAELLTATGRPDSALGYVTAIVKDHRDSPLVDNAVFKSAELYLLLGDVDEAIAACTKVAEESPDSRLASVASEKLGDILWHEKGEPRQALEEYTRGLDKYPDSLVAPRVRDKVARLRREVG